ncbi:MAG: Ig-like domain-containing protein, partial [Oscillospiraceae bacterium]|nr:Ig-like domain-containing protein [Oscillospiraceae bacterium]
MKDLTASRRILTLTAAVALTLSASALALSGGQEEAQAAYVADFSKNTVSAEVICFSAEEFQVLGSEEVTLDSLMVTSLPDQDVGILTVGSLPVSDGDLISASALDTLRFYPAGSESSVASYLTFTPVFSSPVAQHCEFTTYKNVAYTGQLSAVDPEGDLLSFQITDKPARGSVTLSEDGSFVYTPYENKTGKDSFSYVAIDPVGYSSEPAG